MLIIISATEEQYLDHIMDITTDQGMVMGGMIIMTPTGLDIGQADYTVYLLVAAIIGMGAKI